MLCNQIDQHKVLTINNDNLLVQIWVPPPPPPLYNMFTLTP